MKPGHLIALTCACLMLAGTVSAASTEPNDNDEVNARIAHIKAKARSKAARPGQKAGTADQLNESNTCGSVDIGNVVGAGKGRQPREVTVIVTGDVINTADCR